GAPVTLAPGLREPRCLRQLLQCRFAPHLLTRLAPGAVHLPFAILSMDGQANRTTSVRYAALHRLANPPDRVRREAVAQQGVVLVHRFEQTEIALLNQVFQAEPAPLIAPRDPHDQPQIVTDQLVTRLLLPVSQHPAGALAFEQHAWFDAQALPVRGDRLPLTLEPLHQVRELGSVHAQ